MPSDPFLEEIRAGLERKLDPLLFEDCCVALLKKDYPGLVPIRGGNDRGWDGAIAGISDRPIPLCATTRKDVRGKLVEDLDTLEENDAPRVFVFACSTGITAAQYLGFMELARSRGFQLHQIHHGDDLADRLYREPLWTKQLLGLDGAPEALLESPISRRPVLRLDPVARDSELAWLRSGGGDRVLAGQPGSGKTYLLAWLARNERFGLFLRHGATASELSQSIRKLHPRTIFVDDAHAYPDTLELLLGVRASMNADFGCIATSWPGSAPDVAERLAVPRDRIHKLELLGRDDILRVYEEMGVEAERRTLHELIDQASNRPGLAVSLGTAFLQGDFTELQNGDALFKSLFLGIEREVGDHALGVAAGLAIAGDRGMRLESLAGALEIGLAEAQTVTALLGSTGILRVSDERLGLWPRQLRAPLVKRFFFQLSRFPHRRFLDACESRDDVILELLRARHREADFDGTELRELIASSQDSEVWASYAWLGLSEAAWVLENSRASIEDLAAALLERLPRPTIMRLLEGTSEPSTSTWRGREPWSVLENWIEGMIGGTDAAVRRRISLFDIAIGAEGESLPEAVRLRCLCLSLSPRLHGTEPDPGQGMKVLISTGGLLPSASERFEDLAKRSGELLRALVEKTGKTGWSMVENLIRQWIDPETLTLSHLQDEVRLPYERVGLALINELRPLASRSAGLAAALRDIGSLADLELSLDLDPVFELLFPRDDPRYPDGSPEHEAAVRRLAAEWTSWNPGAFADKLVGLHREATTYGRHGPRYDCEVVSLIAEQAPDTAAWLEALLDADTDPDPLPPDILEPWLERIVREQPPGWIELWRRALLRAGSRQAALIVSLRFDRPTAELLDKALSAASENYWTVETLCLRGEVPHPTLERLLQHQDPRVARAAAIGAWQCDPQGYIPDDLRLPWERAILARAVDRDTRSDDYWLGKILEKEPQLAESWLGAQLAGDQIFRTTRGPDGAVKGAIRALSTEGRIRTLGLLGPHHRDLVIEVVERDPDCYRALLELPEIRNLWLAPLQEGELDDSWKTLARMARKAGCGPADLYYPMRSSWSGSGRTVFEDRREFFASLRDDPDLSEVGRRGVEMAEAEIAGALATEKKWKLDGA